MRFGRVQWMPSAEEISRRSLVPAKQKFSKRQSVQTTYTLPDLSISAEGRSGERIAPGGPSLSSCVAITDLLQVLPPSMDLKDRIAVSTQSSMGTMTVPLGCTTGWPPMTQV